MKQRRRRGATIVEAITAATLTVMVLTASVGSYLAGMRSWAQGQGYLDAEVEGQQALRRVTSEIREAMSVTVATDGLSLTYQLPQRLGSGDYVSPPVSDGVSRRVYLAVNPSGLYDLKMGPVGSEALITRKVILTDPDALVPNSAYRPFVAGPGAITRQIAMMFVTKANGARDSVRHNRTRETIFLRNVPIITR